MENFNNYILDTRILRNNVKQLKKFVGKDVKICAMVKADAYGHGLEDVCKSIQKYVGYYGVASVLEAKHIRSFDDKTNILIVGIENFEYANWCAKNNVTITITSIKELQTLESLLNEPIKIHFKIDTGLNRIGFNSLNKFKKAVVFAKKSKKIKITGIYTHFATKQNDVNFIKQQHNLFLKYVQILDVPSATIHCCNSFATLYNKDWHHNMVRCGFNLYGWQTDFKMKLLPSLKINSKIIFVHKIKKGETVGYDRTFTAHENGKIGVVPLGYADGFDRGLSNSFKVLINGQWAPVVGNVCMDVFMVDLTHVVGAKSGSIVTILGRNGGLELTPYTYAKALNTSPYEILLKFKYSRMNKICLGTKK